MSRRIAAALMMTMAITACGPRETQAPVQAVPDTAGEGARRAAERERMRQDSIARAASAADAEARRRAEGTARARAVLEEMVHFDYDESDIRPDAQEVLSRKVPILRANPDVRIRIVGHTDERGSLEYNLALGMRRANAVREYLTGFGIDASRLETTSMGEDSPLAAGSNEGAWSRNRRAEFVITAGGATLMFPGS